MSLDAICLSQADRAAWGSALDELEQDQQSAAHLTDPSLWVVDRLDEHVWSKQDQIMRAVVEHRRTAVRSCHSAGKSHLASRIVAWWLSVHAPGEAFVVTTAPTYAQVRAILWRYIRQAHRKGNLPGRVNQTEWHLGEDLVAFGRKPADHDEAAFQGIHARWVLVVLDEASGIPEQLWVAADALTTNPDCRILAIGNPDNSASHFARVCNPGSLWHVIGVSAFDTPNFTDEQVPDELRQLLISRSWAEEKLLEWGEDNPIYRSKVLGEFSVDDPGRVIRGSDLAACRIAPHDPRAAGELTPVELGVDVGGGGDETVVRERRGVVAGREWREFSDQPSTIAPLILRAIRETGAAAVKVDEIGVGRGVIGELQNMAAADRHQARIVPVNVSTAARRVDQFENVRAEIWWEIGRLLSQDRQWDLSGMDNADTTVAQLLEPRWEVGPKGRIRIEKKDEIRKRLGRSPDNADALLLAFYTPKGSATGFLDQLVSSDQQQDNSASLTLGR
ncbi:MAG TPA: hypothetical protein VGJ13_05190 [Pseudonocardiaceae bacterium]|jgi:hypothetical protein